MIALLQRISAASVKVGDDELGRAGKGLLVFLGIEKDDEESKALRIVDRILGYRVFSDAENKMNLSVLDIDGDILLVPQFTLVADTKKGMRPSFSSAADPVKGKHLFDTVVNILKSKTDNVSCGKFGADMNVELINSGPVTFWLQS